MQKHKHTIIHDFGNDHYNIAPIGVHPKDNKYGQGAVGVHKDEISHTDKPVYKEDVLDELAHDTLLSYRSKAKDSLLTKGAMPAQKANKRLSGIYKAQTKISSTEAKGGMTLKRTGKMPGKK